MDKQSNTYRAGIGCKSDSTPALRWTALAALLLPSAAYADDMSGLFFVFILWPITALLGIILASFSLYAKLALLRPSPKKRRPKFGTFMIASSIVSNLLYLALVLANELAAYHPFETIFFALGHVAFFQLFTIPCFLLGRRVRRQSTQRSP